MNDVPEDVANILAKVAKNENIANYEIKLREGNKKGEGFLGDVIFAELNQNGKTVLSLVIKRAFSSEKLRDIMPIKDTFENEIYFYNVIWPGYKKLEEEFTIKTPISNISKCYGTSAEDLNEYLVLENLRDLGFQTYPKAKDLTRGHVDLIFRTYGKIHGTSFALKKKYPEKYQEFAKNCKNIYETLIDGEHFARSITDVVKIVHSKLTPGKDNKYLEKFDKYLEKSIELYRQSIKYRGKYLTILHGDCWSNNMMFKNNDDGSVSDIKIIDWQLIQEGSPTQDLVYCLYSGASKEDLDDLDNLLKIYHKSLEETLSQFGEKVEEVYPFEALKEDWQHTARFGMLFSFVVCKMKLTDQKDVVDLKDFEHLEINDETKSMFMNIPVASAYDTKVRNLVYHMYDIGAL